MLLTSGVTDKGRVRATNEDCFAIDLDLGLCVVADGMGGHNAGEVASTLAVDTILEYLRAACRAGWPFGFEPSLSEAGNRLRTAIYLANRRVLEVADECPDFAGMGTTVVAMLLGDGRITIAHAGDSRLYRFGCGRLTRLTVDDSWLTRVLADNPDADPESFRNDPMRNVLTNVVGATSCTDVHVAEVPLEEGDLLLLTTDGVHGVFDDEHLERLVREGGEPEALAAALVNTALDRGSRDNCTAIVARYVPD
jgi:protein phosphatase